MADRDDAKIRVIDLAKAFGGHRALAGVTFEVAPARSLVLIGGSGSGKSLVLKCILGLVAPDAGRIVVDGLDTAALAGPARRRWMRRFGVLFQRQGLFDSLPVWQNVVFRLIHEGATSRAAARKVADAKLAAVGLPADTGDLYPAELSGGMQKRVGLARAIAADPEILLLDEPMAGLDPIVSNMIADLIRALGDELHATVIAITSDMAGARKIAQTAAMLHDGAVVWRGATAELFRSGNPHVHQFVNQLTEGPIAMPVAAA